MAQINVTVTVDTANITSSNLSSTVVLTDDNGDSDKTPGDSETFDIKAAAGDTVAFSIVAKDDTTGVSFDSFRYESGDTGVFNPLPSSSNNWTGTAAGSTGDSEFFYIDFTVSGKGSFTLDPEIEIDPGAA